jgi:hypothetical protein
MIKTFTRVLSAGAVLAVLSIGAFAQDTEKKVVVHPDGSYSVIEYPVNKEVVVNLLPTAGINGSHATARVARMADGTKVYFDVSGAPADWTNVYAYAVDPGGTPTLLGPITFSEGVGKAQFMTPMNQFMLVLSPTENLAAYDTSTAYVYRSEAPQGYAIVPRRFTSNTKAVARATSVDSAYQVPMLGVPKFEGKTTEVRVKFNGELAGLDGKAYLKPEGGKTTIKMRFSDMKKVPADKRFVLWASGPDGSFTKIGQVINTGARDESEIRGETALADFGLLLTLEDTDVEQPTSKIYSPFTVGQR